MTDILNKEPGYTNARFTTGGLAGGSGSKVLQFTINADLFPRKPEDFKRKLPPPPPPPKLAPAAPKPEEIPFDPFDVGGGQ